jgi:hypothetical protein
VVRRPAILVVAGAVVAGLVVVALGLAGGWWSGSAAPAPAEPIAVQAVVTPSAVQFGDPITATAVATVDPRRVAPASVRLKTQFLSYRVADSSRVVRRAGGATTIAWTYALECLGAGCAPGRPQLVLAFPNAVVRYRTVGGGTQRLTVVWPAITVASRLSDEDRAAPIAHLRADAPPPPVSYDVSPDALVDGLVAGTVVLALAAVVLLWLAFRRRRAEHETVAVAAGPPLTEALRLVRETASNGHGPGVRRLALQRLVRELRAADKPGLAADAGRLAWSDGPPSAGLTNELADRVENEVGEP